MEFLANAELKTKVVTVDRRLNCSKSIEKAFYASEGFAGKNERTRST